ncbi:pyridoxal-dependent decarboxylase, exosortase A system-associated [Sphingomonas changnyeongensis]|uniref:Pyridoxal-dependent decarboxylase, exosortase A system-associated n=1 Tax=Sphingomonas changnyeongensis TaxID=2698679 RepID=A0A7Z2NWE4_9SPHN|nr:pyridoxal-dependent decarboxylase, exosortase A system-associated [Sphingomonas changnyeongensis]QHL91083.1 pyridoxal-dependent decarboxylase, exosortase A system-associated [Sphingomonas changnyeongensis]
MKPAGPIPPDYAADADGRLLIAGQPYDALIEAAGQTPLFVYDSGAVARRIARLRAAMPGIDIHYAMKANPHAGLLARIAAQVDGIDIASAGELRIAEAAGIMGDRISFAGPGKRDAELEAAILAGVTINLESETEAERALAIAARLGVRPRLAVRVNPDFELRGSGMRMGGGARPFGVDAARAVPLVRRLVDAGADWRGFHIYAGSQSLDAAALIEAQAAGIALAAALAEAAEASPPLVNLGGGFGIPYFSGDVALDVEAIGAALVEAVAARPAVLGDARFALELGRWLVGEAGVYLTRIVDRKTSHDQLFLITDGGLHHQLAASGNFGTVVRRNYPLAIAGRIGAPATEVATVCGCLCTPLDRLGDQLALPEAQVGDVVALFCAGAYGASASPAAFLAQGAAAELLV